MPGEIDVRKPVPKSQTVTAALRGLMPRRRAARIAGQALVLVALVGGTAAYAINDTTVELTVDGQTQSVRAFGTSVSDVLAAADVSVGERDVVAPAPGDRVSDGDKVVVRHARELVLTVDGATAEHWTTALNVDDALADIGLRADDAVLSASRSTPLGRDGLALEMRTPKDVQVVIDGTVVPATSTAATVAALFTDIGVSVGAADKASVPGTAPLVDGLVVAVTRVASSELVETVAIPFETENRETDELYEGEREVEQAGKVGTRTITYTQVLADGTEVAKTKASDTVTTAPRGQVVLVGTKAKPEPEPEPARASSGSSSSTSRSSAPAVSGGSTWDALAQCEAGGNWSISTGNGYYGGLQSSASSWRAVGGSGLPHENSRETQIQMGERLKAAQGWGAWPSCSAKLGLR